MSDNEATLVPETSPLIEADPNSVNELIATRLDDIFNKPPALVSDEDLKTMIAYYRKERARFAAESQAKAAQPPKTRKKAPTSVTEALNSAVNMF